MKISEQDIQATWNQHLRRMNYAVVFLVVGFLLMLCAQLYGVMVVERLSIFGAGKYLFSHDDLNFWKWMKEVQVMYPVLGLFGQASILLFFASLFFVVAALWFNYRCPQCEKILGFPNSAYVREHSSNHKDLECPKCKRKFRWQWGA